MNAARTAFFPLSVAGLRRTTRDAVALTLEPPPGAPFDFRPGQYLTFRRDFGGTEIRRSYSICSAVGEGVLRVGIKRVDGGAFSTWANDALEEGDVLEAMPPQGRFGPPLDPSARHRYLGVAGGSGITPVLSILRSVLDEEPASRFTLLYANRSPASVMFRDEIEDLKNRHMGRLQVIHVLEEGEEAPMFSGRLDADRCDALFGRLVDVGSMDAAFLCGPEPMMRTVAGALAGHGMPEEAIRYELFSSDQGGRLPQAARAKAASRPATRLTAVLDGVAHEVEVSPGQTVLEAALAGGIEAPWSCRAGVCSTCRCRVLEGTVEMAANHALEDDEVAAGFALSCQALPTSEALRISYDAAH